MSQLGEQLRLARESKDISIAQASLDTRILQRYLVALEAGDLLQLPGDVYARGFVRNYAAYLEMPVEEVVELYRRERGVSDRIKVVPAASAPRVRAYVLPNFLGVFFITFALLGLTYIALSALGRIGDDGISTAARTTTVAQSTPTTLATEAIAAIPATIVVPTLAANNAAPPAPTLAIAGGTAPDQFATAEPSATPAAPIMVKVSVKEDSIGSWLRIQVDGETQFEGIMKGGESQDFQAKRRIFIRSGNPAVVFVSVNGLEQQVLSPLAGKPTNWEWPPQ